MDASLVFAQFLSGLYRGMMLFLIASGLSLIFDDLIKVVWGVEDKLVERPSLVKGPVFIIGMPFDSYWG